MQRSDCFFATICIVTQRLREWLVLILIALLPIHALFVTVGTKFIAGPENVSILYLALWKEVVLAIILFIAVVEIIIRGVKWKMENGKWKIPLFDLIDVLIVILLGLSIAVTILNSQFSILNEFSMTQFSNELINLFN